MFVVLQATLEDIHPKALFSACVIWICFGVGFCIRKQAICSWDLSGMCEQFGPFGSRLIGFWVPQILLTSQCTERYLLSVPPLASKRTENQRMLYHQKAGVRVQRSLTFCIYFVGTRHLAMCLVTLWRVLKLRMCLLCPVYINWANGIRQRCSL